MLNAVTTDNDGTGVCIWVKFKGTKEGRKTLLDTGAGISLMPKQLYDIVSKSQDIQMRPTDKRIR